MKDLQEEKESTLKETLDIKNYLPSTNATTHNQQISYVEGELKYLDRQLNDIQTKKTAVREKHVVLDLSEISHVMDVSAV